MRKIYFSTFCLFMMFLHSYSQFVKKDTTTYQSRKLNLEEVNFVSSYYDQTADKSAVMGGRTDAKGIADVTDFANGIDVKFVGTNFRGIRNSLSAGLGIDYHTAASQAYVDSNGTSKNDGLRVYPTLDWTIENQKKGTEYGLGLYYSAEHNYYHSFGINGSFGKKTHSNGEFDAKITGYFDQIKMIIPTEFVPVDSVKNVPARDSVVYITTASGRTEVLHYVNGQVVGKSGKQEIPSSSRNTVSVLLSFSQVINSRLQGSIAVEPTYQSGYLGLPFHRVYFNNGKDTIENLPSQRFKLPVGLRLNYFLGDNIILRTYYRFYVDSWGLISNTANLEVPIKINPFLSVSPFYRYYVQTAARYFAPYAEHSPSDEFFTSNYALAAFTSHFFGMGIRMAPPNGVLMKSLSVMEIRYGHYTQSTNLNANIISMSLKFK